MPIHPSRLRAAVPLILAGCLLVPLSLSTTADAKRAKPVPAGLRVVDSSGETLAEHTQYTGPGARLRSDRRADCFGPGTGGSGKRVEAPAGTALAHLAAGARVERDLRPLSISDNFDFGLALCGIGRAVSPQTGFWYLKIDHVAATAGGDQTSVAKGDDVLWYLIDDYMEPTPDELALDVVKRDGRSGPVTVRVRSYDGNGKRSPAAGVQVSGASKPTNNRGRTVAAPQGKLLRLRATRAGSIPSNEVVLCTVARRKCPPGYGRTIGGTGRADRIRGGRAAEKIRAGGGRDVINARRGAARDAIDCGPGKDRVILARGQKPRLRSCERVVRVHR